MEDEQKQQRIAEIAFGLWLERGCPSGSPDVDWLRAEREYALSLSGAATELEHTPVDQDGPSQVDVSPPDE